MSNSYTANTVNNRTKQGASGIKKREQKPVSKKIYMKNTGLDS